jgi:hypothetical protein
MLQTGSFEQNIFVKNLTAELGQSTCIQLLRHSIAARVAANDDQRRIRGFPKHSLLYLYSAFPGEGLIRQQPR